MKELWRYSEKIDLSPLGITKDMETRDVYRTVGQMRLIQGSPFLFRGENRNFYPVTLPSQVKFRDFSAT